MKRQFYVNCVFALLVSGCLFVIAAEPVGDAATADDAAAVSAANESIKAGNAEQAIADAMKIREDKSRYDMLQKIAKSDSAKNQSANAKEAGNGAAGGAAAADFDSLMELITTTVSPEDWEEVGGTGTVAPFPTGVALDARGRKLKHNAKLDRPLIIRDGQAADTAVAEATAAGLRSVSLPRLESALLARFAAGLEPTNEMLSVGGLARIDYVAVYPEQGDVVLVGPVADDPTIASEYGLHLSDLATALHNALHGSGKMVCAITPSQANLARTQAYLAKTGKRPLKPGGRNKWVKGLREALGKQDVEFEDVEPDSHMALTLLAADYHMKLIGMGIKPGGEVTSYLDTVELKADGTPPDMAVLRWWFTLLPADIETNTEKDVFRLPGQLLQVQSENEMLADRGVRQHTGESEPLNRQFAARFTTAFPQLAAKYPIYAQLHRSAELIVSASLLRDQGLCERAGWEPTFLVSQDPYLTPHTVVPRQVDTVANHRVLNRKTIIAGISGGVEFQPRSLKKCLKVSDNYALSSQSRAGAPSRSRHEVRHEAGGAVQWWWD